MNYKRKKALSDFVEYKQRKYYKGTVTKREYTFVLVGLIIMFGIVANMSVPQYQKLESVQAKGVSISPTLPSPTPTVTPTPTPEITEQDKIRAYIIEVFGTHSAKAFRLLSCENSTLDPRKTNTYGNTPSTSTDWGVFMINDHWQGVTNKAFLTDYKINIQMAWNIYSRDGYTFKLWTCGRKLGI